MIQSLRDKAPAWLWAGVVAFVVTFLPLFTAIATGWWEQFIAWFTTEGVEFPSLSLLSSAVASAVGAAVPAAINAGFRYLQEQGVLRGSGPTYP